MMQSLLELINNKNDKEIVNEEIDCFCYFPFKYCDNFLQI